MPLPQRPEYSDPDGFRKCMIPLIEGTKITTLAQANDAHQRIRDSLMDAIGLGKFLVEKKRKTATADSVYGLRPICVLTNGQLAVTCAFTVSGVCSFQDKTDRACPI
jgi:hypothetical protein